MPRIITAYAVKPTYMLRIYVDANVFLNTWFLEMHRFDPLFERAERLLQAVVDCRFFLIISTLTLKELSRKMSASPDDVKSGYFRMYESVGKLSIVTVTQDMVDEAKHAQLRTHLSDAIHAVVARRENAVLVTRNIRDFRVAARKLNLDIRRPDDLI